MTSVPTEIGTRPRRRGVWLAATLWVGFVVLLLAIAGLLLRGCAIRAVGFLPQLSLLFPDHCHSASSADGDLIRAAEAAVRSRQLALVRKAAACPKSCPAPATPQPAIVPRSPPATRRTEGEQIRKDAEGRGAKTGRLQVTLTWNTKDDVDLHVSCPGGQITPWSGTTKGPGICGDGILDVDANRYASGRYVGVPIENPIENITWNNKVPDGEYRVLVRPNYLPRNKEIEYRLAVKLDDEEKLCRGTVAGPDDADHWRSEYAITFSPTHPLPDCTHVPRISSSCTNDCKP